MPEDTTGEATHRNGGRSDGGRGPGPDGGPGQLPATAAETGRLAHEMNNAVAYVITNLNILTEEIEQLELPPSRRKRLLRLLDEASEGGERVSELVRRMKVLSWGEGYGEVGEDDTWDEVGGPKRVLVVDDEPYILASVHRALKRYHVVVADSGERAIELMKGGERFDIVLCDLVMGKVSGMDVYAWIQDQRPELVKRVIFMTAGAFTPAARDFLATVHNPVLHKPFDTKTLRWILAQTSRGEV